MKNIKLSKGQELLIREAVRSDAEDLINYVNEVAGETDFLTFGRNELGISLEQEEDLLEQYFNSENKIFLLAIIDNEIVGSLNFSSGSRERVRHVGSFGISIKKKFWGLGIGKELMEYMIEWARNGEVIRKINLRVREDNDAAIGLYSKLGFKKEGLTTRDLYIKGVYYSCIYMGLEI